MAPRDIVTYVHHLSDDDIMMRVGPATWAKGLAFFTRGDVLDTDLTSEREAQCRVKGPGLKDARAGGAQDVTVVDVPAARHEVFNEPEAPVLRRKMLIWLSHH